MWWCKLLHKERLLNLGISSAFRHFQLDLIANHLKFSLIFSTRDLPSKMHFNVSSNDLLKKIELLVFSYSTACLPVGYSIFYKRITELCSAIFRTFITQLLSWKVFKTVFSDNCSENFRNFSQEHNEVLYYSSL